MCSWWVLLTVVQAGKVGGKVGMHFFANYYTLNFLQCLDFVGWSISRNVCYLMQEISLQWLHNPDCQLTSYIHCFKNDFWTSEASNVMGSLGLGGIFNHTEAVY